MDNVRTDGDILHLSRSQLITLTYTFWINYEETASTLKRKWRSEPTHTLYKMKRSEKSGRIITYQSVIFGHNVDCTYSS